MPMDVRQVAVGGEVHPNPFVGPIFHPVAIRVDISALTDDFVDSRGYLKAGVPLTRAGVPAGGAGTFVHGCVIEAVKVHTDNTTLAAATKDIDVAIVTICQVNRAILEDSIGRVLSAGELAAFDAAGSRCVLLFQE
jgi:hypothetical protein